MTSGIYKLHWENCKYFYIGQSIDLKQRQRWHFNKLKSNSHNNAFLTRVYLKYGLPTFTILEEVPENFLDTVEQGYLNIYFDNFHCCNLAPIAASCKGVVRDEVFKNRLREANIGLKKSSATKAKIAFMKTLLTSEQKENIAKGQRGKIKSEKSNEKRRLFMLNVSADYRNRMRELKLGTYIGSQNHSSKLVLNTQTGVYYETLKQAGITTPFKYGYLKMMLSGHSLNKTHLIYA